MKSIWQQISNTGVKDEMSYEVKRRIILLNRISISLFLIVFTTRTLVVVLGFQEFSMRSIMPFVSMTGILIVPFLNKKGYYRFNSFIFSIVVPVCFLFFSVLSQQSNEVVNVNHYYVPRLFILSSLILPMILIDKSDRWPLIIAILVNFLCILSFDFVVNLVGVPFNPEKVSFDNFNVISKIMLLPALLLVLGFSFLNNLNRNYEKQIIGLNTDLQDKNNELEQFNEEITAQRDMIVSKNELLENANKKVEHVNKMMTDSIMYAEKIQRAVLHDEKLPNGFFKESFIYFKPKQHVSGDFYFYKEHVINNEKCLIVTAVDCTGHGVPGGFLSMLGITLLNEIVLNEKILQASEILNELRDRIKNTLNQTGTLTEQRDGMDMALCIYCPSSKKIQYAGARMPLYIIDKLGELTVVSGDRQPIGVFRKEKDFTNHVLELKGDEMLYLFSDGVQDQFGGPEGKKIMVSRLKRLLLDMSNEEAEIQKKILEDYFESWMHSGSEKSYEQVDDVVFLGMRV